MAQLSTSFDDSAYGTGSQPPDWTAQWSAAVSGANAVFTVETDTTNSSFGDQVLQDDHTGGGEDSALSWDDVGTPADADIKMRVRWLGLAYDADYLGAIVRGDEDSGGKIGYALRVNRADNTMRILEFSGGGVSELAIVTLTYVLEDHNTRWYWLRFQVTGTAIKAKFWRDGEDEPGAWDIDTSDATISAGGWVGVMSYNYDAQVDWFGVGTAGSAPPAVPAAEGDALVTQAAVEVLRAGDPDALVTQATVEVLRDNVLARPVVVVIGS